MFKRVVVAAALAFAASGAAHAAEGMACCKDKECCCKKENDAANGKEADHSRMDHGKPEAAKSELKQP